MAPKEIRSRRLALGLRVDELALGLGANVVRAFENGKDPPLVDAHMLDQVLPDSKQRERNES